MSNFWLSDDILRDPWARLAGKAGFDIYVAATALIHRRGTDSVRVTVRKVLSEIPWEYSTTEISTALNKLEALEKILVDGDEIALPDYEAEQESFEKMDARKKKGQEAARIRWERERMRKAEKECSEHAHGKDELPSAQNEHAPDASSPLLSAPSAPLPSIPPSAGAASPPSPPAPDLPAEKPPKETPEQTVQRYMTTAPRNDDGQDRVWRYYATRFFVECGSLPTYPKKRNELNALKDLCVGHGPEEVCRRLGIYFDDPPWGLHDGGRDLERFFKNFDKLAVGSGKHARREKSDRSLKFQFAMREKLAGLNGHGPILAPEYRDWIKADPAPAPQPISSPRGDERFALTTPEEDPRDPF